MGVRWLVYGGLAVVALVVVEEDVLVSSLLLLPVVYLFRFAGCSILLSESEEDEPPPEFPVLLQVDVPAGGGSGLPEVNMRFFQMSTEAENSPVDLDFVGEANDIISFDKSTTLPMGEYEVDCTSTRTGEPTRTGDCSGNLSELGLRVTFGAPRPDPGDKLEASACFEAPEDQA